MNKHEQKQWDGSKPPDGLAEALSGRSLGDPHVVTALVRDFAYEVTGMCRRYHAGDLDDLEPALQAESRRLGAIFTGRTPGYQTTSYNTARLGGLRSRAGAFLMSLAAHDSGDYLFDTDDPVAGLFFCLAHQVAGAFIAAHSGEEEHDLPQAMQHISGLLIGYPDAPR